MKYLPYILIAVALFVSGGIYIDRTASVVTSKNETQSRSEIKTASNNGPITFKNYGKAPEFSGIAKWLNSEPLTMANLKGKVVLVDFWTYSCINCIRTLPYVTKWYDAYKDQGLVVIGVHTPEFEFEKVSSNVETAIKNFGIHYPVPQDNSFSTWQAFKNQYWPAEYLIDQNGNIVYEHFGEGEYDHTENAIRQLLGLDKPVAPENGQDLSKVRSPEMYFGTDRLQYLTPSQSPSLLPTSYTLPPSLKLNQFALEGEWKFGNDKITCTKAPCKIRLHYSSKNVYMVAGSEKSVQYSVSANGEHSTSGDISGATLYPVVESKDYGEGTLDIQFYGEGVEVFTFTFG